ncbi:sugar transferase [Jeotgalibacillus salarius]|uniref:Sugar transferase n=1 Tax=Jeotgalibacillus salarius TaxID=546023 RepID=A0A4Y8LRQ8_9BACL|nr:sugar transferase [Jeotgalibacillus salarius]TFE04139.1 sugar transferase [Jeotgalibacillus salarius]
MRRFIDFSLSLLVLLFLMPFGALIALLIWLTMGRPILFIQERSGINGKVFDIYKFRTMIESSSHADQERITKLGNTLRKYSIDEWPQLINILKGEMSFIGPRPLLPEYLSLYNEEQRMRLSVKPGITGWAQVKGRNAISWEQKFEFDCWYVRNRSVWLDIKILFMTCLYIIKPKGINQNDAVTMERFSGEKVHEELNEKNES